MAAAAAAVAVALATVLAVPLEMAFAVMMEVAANDDGGMKEVVMWKLFMLMIFVVN